MWHKNSHDSNDSIADGLSPQGCQRAAEAVSYRLARVLLSLTHCLETEKSIRFGGFPTLGCFVPEIPKVPVSRGGIAEENLIDVFLDCLLNERGQFVCIERFQ